MHPPSHPPHGSASYSYGLIDITHNDPCVFCTRSAWYFYGLIALLAASLMACTSTTQWPAVKVRGRMCMMACM